MKAELKAAAWRPLLTPQTDPRPARPQARGRALLNLRCSEIEGGLLGRQLLTLVSNKGFGGPPMELPAHKFGPHDVVAVRPSKSGGEGQPICSGVIYRWGGRWGWLG